MELITNIFELWDAAYLGDFSKYMYAADGYSSVFYVMLLLPVAVAFVYYIVLDHILLARTGKWALTGAVTSVAAAVIAAVIARAKLEDYAFRENIYDAQIVTSDYVTFAVIVFGWAFIFYIIASLLFKSFSSRCRNVPF